MTLSGYSNIPALSIGQPVGSLITVLNENSEQTNEIREVVEVMQTVTDDIGNTSQIPGGRTVVEQLAWLSARLGNFMDSRGMIVEFLSADPVYGPEDIPSPFYFNTLQQTLMVWHEGEGQYFPAFGCKSVIDTTVDNAPIWEYAGPVVPPAPPVGCLTLPVGTEIGSATLMAQLPSMSMTSALAYGSMIYTLSIVGNTTRLYKTDLITGFTTPVATYNGKLIKPMMVINSAHSVIYSLGGSTDTGAFSSNIVKFDLLAETASHIGNMPTSFRGGAVSYNTGRASAFIFGGETLVGGFAASPLNSIHRFDFATETVSIVPTTLPAPLTGIAATTDVDSSGFIYLAGGRSGNTMQANSLTNEVMRFNPVTNALTEIGQMNGRKAYGRMYLGTAGDLIYVGGYGEGPNACILQVATTERYLLQNASTSLLQLPSIGGAPMGYVDTFGAESAACGYAIHIVNRGNTLDDVYVIKL